ncbi:MAG: hypothetical protein A3J06_00960 [Candidatus Moranbacteria bacterium RIFCSPLOWO2_02_FULL_48_19]|nr:MAG: hypothetical protein A3J06_00960 [Candidatus Moranbacteria bacterium RIFCSPLOWO2_02_FULL_48_19]OGI31568.1 MAG: hypothetical protein A3G09_04615 [Candidatus Moranbacteria bacterium RIFCSPLOWO2_12_FULL_48_12]
MAALPRVGIIVLNYNGKRCLPACLNSLNRLEYPDKEIIIVDNHSSDDSLLAAEKTFPQFIFVRNRENEGFAKGINVGIRAALARGAEYCWLINYDTEVDPSALTRLIAVAQKYPQAGLLSPVIYPVRECHAGLSQDTFSSSSIKPHTIREFSNEVYEKENQRPWFAKGKINFFRMRALHTQPAKKELARESYSSEFLTGCALLVKKELVEAIGLLDERFFLYYEDADYSLRAASAGFACLVVPGARVWHAEVSRAHPKKTYFLVHSGLLFFEKHAPFLLRPYLWVYVTIRRVKNRLDLTRRKGAIALEVHQAYEHFFHER